jgi:hypothetical protein
MLPLQSNICAFAENDRRKSHLSGSLITRRDSKWGSFRIRVKDVTATVVYTATELLKEISKTENMKS